jgi:hypothetical protein
VKYAQCVKIWSFDFLVLFLKCVLSEVLCSVSYGHYTESDNCSIFDKEKGRRVMATRVSHTRQREMIYIGVLLPFT